MKANFIVSLLAGLALSRPTSDHVVHEKRSASHPRWAKSARLHPRSVLPMRIGLTQTNLHKAEDYMMDVAHPESPNYGKHWTAEEVADAFKPTDDTVDAVRQWLIDHGITEERISQSSNKQWLRFDATREEAEDLLKTEFHEFHDQATGNVQVACDDYSVPSHVQPHVDYITPGIRLLAPDHRGYKSKADALAKRALMHGSTGVQADTLAQPWLDDFKKSNASDLSNCDKRITPACIRALYDIPEKAPKTFKTNNLAIYESQNQWYWQPDLDSFFSTLAPQIPNGTHPVPISINGGYAGSAPNASTVGEEANLDFQLAYPIVYPQTITLYSDDDYYYGVWPNDTYKFGFNTFLDALDGSYCDFEAYGEKGDASIDPHYPDTRPGGYDKPRQCGVYQPTNVISFSYGGQEQFLPVNYQKRQCLEYLKLGMQGTTFLFASGDSGIGDYPLPYGMTSNTGCIGPKSNIFNPTWPDNCPWVTSVGATKVYPGHSVTGPDPESAVFDPAGHPYSVNFSSGGGFSNVYAPAKYQQTALDTYFKDHNPPYPSYSGFTNDTSTIGYSGPSASGGVYNRAGRGIPDVAAVGDNIAIFNGGKDTLSGGTSASTPIFAAIITRINSERLAVGKKPVGFINAVLYAHPEVFRDIVNGSNPDCGYDGFQAVKGWDPVTGLGTPHYPKLLDLFMSLP